MSHRSRSRSVGRRDWLKGAAASAASLGLASSAVGAPGSPAREGKVQAYDQVEPQKFAWGWIRWLMNAQIDPKAEMTLGIVHIEPGQTNPAHTHPSAEYLHVLAGQCEHRLGSRWMSLKTGDTLRIPKGLVHQARTHSESCRVLVVYDTGIREMFPEKPASPK